MGTNTNIRHNISSYLLALESFTFIYVIHVIYVYVWLCDIFSQLRLIFSKSREVQGTLTDVYGHRRVHRLSLMINKHGDIRTIYCVPCGPLVYADQTEQLTMISQDRHNLREDEYTKVSETYLLINIGIIETWYKIVSRQAVKQLYTLHASLYRYARMNGCMDGQKAHYQLNVL